ncbi:uncharacterized protein TNCV_635441 [Trichonephila clavipes]|nr:uncharacterized protein TNCV_635441 [Trichonephila clavipes]
MQKTGFLMLNDDKIVTSVQEESDHIDNEKYENKDINNESSKKSIKCWSVFCVRYRYGVVRTTITVLSYSTIAAQENQILQRKSEATRGLLATDHVILNHGQVTWTTPELAPPLLTTTPHQREDVAALDRFNVHRCPTRRVF